MGKKEELIAERDRLYKKHLKEHKSFVRKLKKYMLK